VTGEWTRGASGEGIIDLGEAGRRVAHCCHARHCCRDGSCQPRPPTDLLAAVELSAAEYRAGYRLNPQPVIIPPHVLHAYGSIAIQASATRLGVTVEVRDDWNAPPLHTFHPEVTP
jgi:hypothetical protein